MHGSVLPPGRRVSDHLPATERSASLRSHNHLQPALLSPPIPIICTSVPLCINAVSQTAKASTALHLLNLAYTLPVPLLGLPSPFLHPVLAGRHGSNPPFLRLNRATITQRRAATEPPTSLCDAQTIKLFIRNYKLVNLPVPLCLIAHLTP